MATHEREITGPVDLCGPDGRLHRGAVGWSRTPLHRGNLRGWGRTKRWEYWCVTTPTHLLALTVSDLDFLTLDTVYFLSWDEHGVLEDHERTAIAPGLPLRPTAFPAGIAGSGGPHGADLTVGPERPGRRRVRISITHEPGGTRLRARALTADLRPLEADLLVALPDGHETLSVVVPWDDKRFQYTSKHTARPATGTVRLGDRTYGFGTDGDSWGVLDHGRGRWPRSLGWNWGAASGRTDGHTVGLQFGGQWTEGTGSTENALCVDGRLSKIGTELDWRHDPADPLAPWRITTPGSDQVDLVFHPFHDRRTRTEAGLIANRTDQCFGHYRGTVRTDDGLRVAVDGLLGWAEDVRMRW
ncbi:DUF2804 domain-containing protein [Kitasatospora cineracea]|uniref:Uncharacterized protein DUF2804 n=1 Tax=Kitasatospora cineracea TaxID=88074 RepID=A0A3N4RXJ6_9ACTN|nr:DUF2804 domain-containing protein [Kitasatospora cineracea]ROR45348.1 uncharacterized protein DUF2804 [Kitasatospora cineracea]RPE35699.1 uncharacterized protein DUF2804 [Kitasatospora cineracea]